MADNTEKQITEWFAGQLGLDPDEDIGENKRISLGGYTKKSPPRCYGLVFRPGQTFEQLGTEHAIGLQVLNRSEYHVQGSDDAKAMFDVLRTATGIQLDGIEITAQTPQGPGQLGPDKQGRPEWSGNYQIVVRITA